MKLNLERYLDKECNILYHLGVSLRPVVSFKEKKKWSIKWINQTTAQMVIKISLRKGKERHPSFPEGPEGSRHPCSVPVRIVIVTEHQFIPLTQRQGLCSLRAVARED